MVKAILSAVDAEHPGWLYAGGRPRAHNSQKYHDAWERRILDNR